MRNLLLKSWEYRYIYCNRIRMRKIVLGALVLFMMPFLGFSQKLVSPKDFQKEINKNKKIQLLDVRTAEEFKAKKIANAVNIDWNDQENFKSKVKDFNKNQPIYMYCLGGGRSTEASKALTEMGYQVVEMQGGIRNWEKEGLPIQSNIEKPKSMSLKKFKELTAADDLVLVDFNAVWCGPCKQLDPIIEKVAKDYGSKLKVLKIDVDENSTVAQALGLKSIPVLHIYKKGKLVWNHTGLTTEKEIVTQLNK